jgi:signal transduction histidine kinase
MKLFSVVFCLLIICMVHKGISQGLNEIDSVKVALMTQTDSIDTVNLMSELSNKLVDSREYDQAQKYLDSVFFLSGKLNYKAGIAKYYNGLGYLFQNQGNYEEALTNFSISLDNWISIGDSLHVADVCFNLGVNYINQENNDKANEFLYRAMRLDSVMGQKSALIMDYNKLALIHRFRGEYPEAINLYEKAIRLAEEIGDPALINKNKLSLGIIYKFQLNYEKALSIFIETVPYYEQTDNLETLIPLDNCVGTIFFHQHDYEEALKHLNSALDASRKLGLETEVAANLSVIGLVYRDLEQYDDALQYEFQALQVYSDYGTKTDVGWVMLDIGDTYVAAGDPDQAMEHYRESLDIAKELQDNECLNAVKLAMAKTMIRLAGVPGKTEAPELYDTARSYLAESLKTALTMDHKENIMNIYRLLYQADSASGDLGAALNNYKNFTLYKDSINDIESKNRLAQLEYDFLRQQKERENEIKSLVMKNQQAALLASGLEDEKNKAQILLMRTSQELQKLQLEQKEKELEDNHSEFLEKEAALASAVKIKELQEREIKKQKMQRNGILFTTVLLLLTGILIIRGIQLRRKLEKQQAISKERERISSDLHDDIGSGLSKIILMLEVLHKESRSTEIKEKTRTISEESLELSKNMSSVVWALNSRYDSLESLIAYIRKYASDYFENSPVGFKMIAPAHFPPVHLSSEQRRNLFYAVKEALHNIIKHAEASMAEVRVTYDSHLLSLTVRDNGCGLPAGEMNRFGNGIIQMRARIEGLGGNFLMETVEGTLITFSLPVGKNRP